MRIFADYKVSTPIVKTVYYPKSSASRKYYDMVKTANGGYGGLLSATFVTPEHAQRFYDAIQTCKGPSLGTNFTLCSPFVILAHYNELDWAEQFGVERDLVRFSIGLEETGELIGRFESALKATGQKEDGDRQMMQGAGR